jgi:hypothetical protein
MGGTLDDFTVWGSSEVIKFLLESVHKRVDGRIRTSS